MGVVSSPICRGGKRFLLGVSNSKEDLGGNLAPLSCAGHGTESPSIQIFLLLPCFKFDQLFGICPFSLQCFRQSPD